jgi:hypothetical protein
VERSVPKPDRQALVERNVKIHNERRDTGFTGYVEYRQQRDVVITTLLTSQPDPQRGTKLTASPDMLAEMGRIAPAVWAYSRWWMNCRRHRQTLSCTAFLT